MKETVIQKVKGVVRESGANNGKSKETVRSGWQL
jgi:hypothetical protein